MTPKCPNNRCSSHSKSSNIVPDGSYFRKSDSKTIKRFRCKICNKRFSAATYSLSYNQNKRRINSLLKKLLCSKVSQRRCAIILGVARKTIERKAKYLGKIGELEHRNLLSSGIKFSIVQFDELQTIEHTKCKPVAVPVVVCTQTRMILDFEVAKMSATGHLAKVSRAKYGKRPDQRRQAIDQLFKRLQKNIHPLSTIITDEHPYYPPLIEKYFPHAKHVTYKGSKGSVSAQGELKKVKYDPLFSINHTLAMMRDNMARLIRRSWCQSKTLHGLRSHLFTYINFHNHVLVQNP